MRQAVMIIFQFQTNSLKKNKQRLEQITQEIADLNRELYNYVNAKEQGK